MKITAEDLRKYPVWGGCVLIGGRWWPIIKI